MDEDVIKQMSNDCVKQLQKNGMLGNVTGHKKFFSVLIRNINQSKGGIIFLSARKGSGKSLLLDNVESVLNIETMYNGSVMTTDINIDTICRNCKSFSPAKVFECLMYEIKKQKKTDKIFLIDNFDMIKQNVNRKTHAHVKNILRGLYAYAIANKVTLVIALTQKLYAKLSSENIFPLSSEHTHSTRLSYFNEYENEKIVGAILSHFGVKEVQISNQSRGLLRGALSDLPRGVSSVRAVVQRLASLDKVKAGEKLEKCDVRKAILHFSDSPLVSQCTIPELHVLSSFYKLWLNHLKTKKRNSKFFVTLRELYHAAYANMYEYDKSSLKKVIINLDLCTAIVEHLKFKQFLTININLKLGYAQKVCFKTTADPNNVLRILKENHFAKDMF